MLQVNYIKAGFKRILIIEPVNKMEILLLFFSVNNMFLIIFFVFTFYLI